MPQVRREVKRKIAFTEEEFASLRARASLTRRPFARYVREAALGNVPAVPTGRLDAELIAQLRRVGNNLNQLAREANAADRFPAERKIEAALTELNALVARAKL